MLARILLLLFFPIYPEDYQTKLFKLQSVVSNRYFHLLKISNIDFHSIKFPTSLFRCRYIAWILVAALYHLPNFQSMGLDLRMNLSLFLTIYISSILFLVVFHIIFLGLWYVGLVSRVAGRRPEILTILQNCAVSSSLPVLHIKATYLLKILSFVVSYKNYCLHVFHRCRFLAWLAVYFTAIVVIELF